jgi:serralysin
MKKQASVQEPQRDLFETRWNTSTISAPTRAEPVQFNLDDYAGGSFRGKPILGLDGVREKIDAGVNDSVNGGVITYTFLDKDHLTGIYNNPKYGFTAGDGVGPFSDAQRAEARQSIQFWDDLIAPSFVEKNGMGADIMFANSADPAQAYAYYPGPGGQKYQSDVFVADPSINWTNAWLGFNGYGATTLIHELGHAIGLSHPGNYNYDPNLPLSYGNYAEYAQDSEQYTIMSYWDPRETNALIIDWNTLLYGNAQTPMLHDIYVIQEKYGADLTTRAGDTVYGFNSTAGRDVFDFSANTAPNVAIYDAGGNDTIDLSGFTASTFLNLHAGTFSSAGQSAPSAAVVNANRADLTALSGQTFAPVSQATIDATAASFQNAAAARIAADTGVTGVTATEYDNLAIAYGTTIENGIGGSARDVLWGNQVANRLEGRGGNDVLNGFEGNDTLVGGAGNDRFDFTTALGANNVDRIADFAAGDKIGLGVATFAGVGSTVGAALSANAFWAGSAAHDADDRIVYNQATGQLFYDADGNGGGAAQLFAQLTPGTALSAADFVLVQATPVY